MPAEYQHGRCRGGEVEFEASCGHNDKQGAVCRSRKGFRRLPLPHTVTSDWNHHQTVRGERHGWLLGNLYKSIEALNTHYMQSNVTKDLVLQPTAVPLPALLKDSWNSSDTNARKVYTCSSTYHSPRYHSDKSGGRCPGCGASMTTELLYADPNSSNSVNNSNLASSSGGFVKGVVTYMVMDNLEVKPMSTISAVTLLNTFNVKDVSCLVEKEVQVGFVEGVAILKVSLKSRAVLTSVFLRI